MSRIITTGPKPLITSAQALTNAWVDLGSPVPVARASFVALYITLDRGNAADMQVRMLTQHTAGGTEHVLPIRTVSASVVAIQDEYLDFTDDLDVSMMLSWTLNGLAHFVQFQVMAVTPGTGEVDAANVVIAEAG